MASHARVQFGEEAEKPLPAQALQRDRRRHGVALTRKIRHAVAAARPPIVRYGTVLHSAFISDTKPYQPKFLSKFFCYLSGVYRMQTLTTEEARNSCEPRLPAWTSSGPARLVPFHTNDLFYSGPSVRSGVTGRNLFIRRLEQPRCSNPNRIRTHETTTRRLPQQMACIGGGQARHADSPQYPRQYNGARARWANCAQ